LPGSWRTSTSDFSQIAVVLVADAVETMESPGFVAGNRQQLADAAHALFVEDFVGVDAQDPIGISQRGQRHGDAVVVRSWK
jgi:hypothetical protein